MRRMKMTEAGEGGEHGEEAELPEGGVDLRGAGVEEDSPERVVPAAMVLAGGAGLDVDLVGGVGAAHEVEPVVGVDVVVGEPA